MPNRYCSKCTKTMVDTNFYTYKNGEKCELCKSCLTMHMNMYEPETFLWALEKFNVPYIPSEWKSKREKEYEKAYTKAVAQNRPDPKKDAYNMTKGNAVVFGKYLSGMRMVQFRDYSWKDSEMLQKKAEEKAKLYGVPSEEMQATIDQMKLAFANGEITEAEYMTYADFNPIEEHKKTLEEAYLESTDTPGQNLLDPYPTNNSPIQRVAIPDIGNDLTDEDKIAMAMKWGQLYTPAEWVQLEQKWHDYENSFDLHNADLISGTLQLCKLDLKGNQALDVGDIESYSKIARASDALRKSLKFTEAQRKEDKTSEFSCYGQLVSYCEMKGGFIPKLDLSIDRDIVDTDIRDIKNYNKSLIDEDPAIFKLIEQYIKKRDAAVQQEMDAAEAKARGEDYVTLTDKDLADYRQAFEEEEEEDDY